MKKNLIIALVLVVLVTSMAWAASINVNTYGTDPSYSEVFNLISSASNTTTGSVYKLGKPFKNVSCIMSNPSGSVPTVVIYSVAGGLDDSSLVTLNTISASSWPSILSTEGTNTNVNVLYVRGSISTWTTNTGAPTSLRLKCVASH